MQKYYVVKKGLVPGIYRDWESCKKNVLGIKDAIYKSFTDYDSAIDYYEDKHMDINSSFDSNILYVFTDGSYMNGIHRYAYILPQLNIEFSRSLEVSTNNRNEFMAILDSLDLIDRENLYIGYRKISIVSDSEYCIKTITIYSQNWFSKDGTILDKSKKNLDIIKSILDISKKIPIEIDYIKIKSHTNNLDILSTYNSKVDKLAKTGRI